MTHIGRAKCTVWAFGLCGVGRKYVQVRWAGLPPAKTRRGLRATEYGEGDEGKYVKG